MHCDESHLRLYAVVSGAWQTKERSLVSMVEQALKGGISALELRETNMNHYDFLAEAYELRDLCKQYHVPFFVAENLDIALTVSADGLHLSYQTLAELQAQGELLDLEKQSDFFLGIGVKTLVQALEAESKGADFLSVPDVFAQKSLEIVEKTLPELTRAVSVPLLATGNINRANLPGLVNSGIAGVAMGRGIFEHAEIEESVKQLFFQVDRLVHLSLPS